MTEPLARLRKIIKENKLDAALISSISNIVYLTGYCGFSKEEREAYLFIVAQPQGLTHKTPRVLGYILTDGRYADAVKNLIPDFRLIEISSKLSAISALKKLIKKHKIKKLGFEGNNLTFLEHKKLLQCIDDLSHQALGFLRTIKTSDEIAKIEKACTLGDKTFDYVLKKVQLGISEKQLAFEIEFFIKKNGADISFPPIVAFGKNSAMPHHKSNDKRLTTKDKIVLLDFGVKLNNYCSDMTRTVFFGKPTPEQKRMYETVLNAQQKAIEVLSHLGGGRMDSSEVNGVKASEIDKVARDYIISKGYKTIPHSVGHGIGINVHETPHVSPKSKDILKPNMVFTIEPGIYIKGVGGIRIEDVVVLEETGIRLLTKSPKYLIEL